jgi:hypothetical protein
MSDEQRHDLDPEVRRMLDVAFVTRAQRGATSAEQVKLGEIALQALTALRAITAPGMGRPLSVYTPPSADTECAHTQPCSECEAFHAADHCCPACESRRKANAERMAKRRQSEEASA